ncbi:MAG: anti-sigma factor [Candidatus Rokubacteria bacterium]|nr:anti-sigma factor [Candidatus Rokubacteria bacterium]
MACNVARSKIFQYLDGELPKEQRSAFESHLASCPDCHRLAELERTFRETYMASLRPDPVPQRVRDQVARILDTLPDDRPAERWWRRRSRLGLAAGAVALLLVGGMIGVGLQRVWTSANPSLIRLAEASVEQHQKLARGILPHDVQRVTPKAAEQWFKRRLDFNVSLPELTREDLTFLGGRVSHLWDFDVAALHYQVEGKDVSLFVIPLEKYRQLGLADSPKFKMVTHQGYDVIVWASHGAAYSLVSEIGGRSCLVCHSRDERLDLPTSSRAHDKL